jgi:phosphoribosylamine--glycine ligase
MMRLGGQALDLLLAAAEGRLDRARVHWADDHAMTVVIAARGYPGAVEKGAPIGGLDGLPEDSFRMMFHAGTVFDEGRIVAAGGRVLNATARGATLAEARDRAYALACAVDLPGGLMRRDIGWRALGKPSQEG